VNRSGDEERERLPLLSVVVVTRGRCGVMDLVLEGLGCQDCEDWQMEVVVVVVVDAGAEGEVVVGGLERFGWRVVRLEGAATWMEARMAGVGEVRGAWVGFLGDHFVPEAGWAAALMEAAGDGRWVALGSVFANGSEDSWWTRASLVADYGHYLAPYAGREEGWLAGSCIAYERGYLVRNRERILEVAGVDFTIQEMVSHEGLRMRVVPGARVGHMAFAGIGAMMAAGYEHARLLVEGRMRMGMRGWWWRVVRLAGLVLVVPLQWVRLGRAMGCGGIGRLVRAFPVVVAGTLAAVLGEASGLLWGVGEAPRRFVEIELGSSRLR
jgi:hypothetical protein